MIDKKNKTNMVNLPKETYREWENVFGRTSILDGKGTCAWDQATFITNCMVKRNISTSSQGHVDFVYEKFRPESLIAAAEFLNNQLN